MLAWALLSIVKNEWLSRRSGKRRGDPPERRARLERPSIQDLAASMAQARQRAGGSRGVGADQLGPRRRRVHASTAPQQIQQYELPRRVFESLIQYLEPTDAAKLMVVCQTWSGPAAEAIYQSPRLLRPDDFGALTALLTSRTTTYPYALMVNELSLEGAVAEEVLMGDLKAALKACTNLLRFRLKGCSHVSNLLAQFLGENVPHLVHLELPGCPISDSFMSNLVRGCKHLRHLDFSFTSITLASIPLLLRDCRHLESLDLTGVLAPPPSWHGYEYTSAQLQSFSSSSSLSSLSQDSGVAPMAVATFERPLVTRVSLSRTDATDATVRFLANHCPNLEHLFIDSCPHVTDQSLVSIAQHCPNLVRLDCSFSSNITDIGVQALAVHLNARGPSQLMALNLTACHHVTPKAVCLLAQECLQLDCIILDGCDRIADWYFDSPEVIAAAAAAATAAAAGSALRSDGRHDSGHGTIGSKGSPQMPPTSPRSDSPASGMFMLEPQDLFAVRTLSIISPSPASAAAAAAASGSGAGPSSAHPLSPTSLVMSMAGASAYSGHHAAGGVGGSGRDSNYVSESVSSEDRHTLLVSRDMILERQRVLEERDAWSMNAPTFGSTRGPRHFRGSNSGGGGGGGASGGISSFNNRRRSLSVA
ncbi:hypothetical protein HK105_201376 [Polyrhizophydium stewartii]|uniref:F-box/LRR-repeat protein 15-like leucin rich repeat domain-containing protein n=1 Tax=Polyrhizophydium stewartii TaxID=2732419 RepID=A0ABR4NHX7_9FUNG|nr:hypothetical protein HK105_007751 [Polyrhizophydium stewartii]